MKNRHVVLAGLLAAMPVSSVEATMGSGESSYRLRDRHGCRNRNINEIQYLRSRSHAYVRGRRAVLLIVESQIKAGCGC
jgi:hypothetical protein